MYMYATLVVPSNMKIPLFLTLTLEIFECMSICCLDVDCMNACIIVISPEDSPHGAYCLCPYLSTYACMSVV